MKTMIAQAVARHPDGLVVSIPEPGLAPAIRRATAAGIPVVSINSGSDVYRRLGVLAHVGQPEGRSGLAAGRRLAGRACGARCGSTSRWATRASTIGARDSTVRCAAGAAPRRCSGSTIRARPPGRIAATIRAGRIDGVLTTNVTTALEAMQAVRRLDRVRSVKIATFDLGPDVLNAVRAGRLLFAVDQQAYLEGYLPVVLLTERARYGLFPAEGDVIATGPHFVTRANAAQAIELSRRSIR